MGRDAPKLRLFVAIYPPHRLVEQWHAALQRMMLPDHRVTPVEQVHLTLQFIGDTPSRLLADVIESVERAASGLARFDLTPAQLIVLPLRGPARLVAVETDRPPTLLELQRRLATRLATRVRRRQDFRPHLTVCRFGRPQRFEMPGQSFATEAFPVETVAIMRSVLHHRGAEHAEIERFELE